MHSDRTPAKSAGDLHKEHPRFQRINEVLDNSKHNRTRQMPVNTTGKSVGEKCSPILVG